MPAIDGDSETQATKNSLARAFMQTLWPAFIGATISVGIVFSLFDPNESGNFPTYFPRSIEGVYTITFLLLWAANTLSSATTWYLTTHTEQGR